MWKSLALGLGKYLLCGLLVTSLASLARAQFNSSLEGNVVDSSGAAVPNANVKIKRIETGVEQKSTTNGDGNFTFPSLPAGQYSVTVSAIGFQTVVHDQITLQPSSVQSVPVRLTPGGVDTSVTVTSEAPPLQTEEAKITTAVSQQEVNDLPLPNRNVLNVVALTPGVTGTGMMGSAPGGVYVSNQSPAISANGQPNSGNMFYVDGTTVNDSPSSGDARIVPNPDAIAQVVVSANDFSAEYGRGSGVIVQMVTKGGTNQFHGSLFEVLQNSALNSRNIFQNSVNSLTGHILSPSRSNEFGGSFGGPIRKDKTFFFVSWDQTKAMAPGVNVQTVETPQFVSFMQQNFPNNISTNLLKSYPATLSSLSNIQTVAQVLESQSGATCTGTGPLGMPCSMPLLGSGVHSWSNPNDGHQLTMRVDQNFSRDRLYANYIGIKQTSTADDPRPQWNFQIPVPSWFAAADWTHILTASALNDMSFGMTYNRADSTCMLCNIPAININGMAGYGYGWAPAHFAQADFHWRDIATLVKGKHSIKAGAEIFANQDFAPFTSLNSGRPQYGFNTIFQFAADTPQSECCYQYNPATGGPANGDHYWKSRYYAGFVQDDFRVAPNFTVSVGLRGEYMGNPYEAHGNRNNLYLGAGPGLWNEIANSYVKQNKYAFNSGMGRFAPRIGFAWQPKGTSNWSVRGGWGMFINRGGNTYWSDTAGGNPPSVASLNLNLNNPTGPYPTYGLCGLDHPPYNCLIPTPQLGLNPRGGPLGATVGIGGPDMNIKLAYAENRFIGIQHSFGGKWVAEADYTGSHGVDLYAERNLNTYVGNMVVNQGKWIGINPYFSNITFADNSNYSEYNGLALSLRKDFGHGVLARTAFTWSKTIDLVSGAPGQNKTEGALVINPWHPNNQRGISSQDIPRQLVFDFIYEVPKPKMENKIAQALLGGWQMSGIGTFAAGLPFTVFSGNGNWSSQAIYYDLPNAPATAISSGGYSRSAFLTGVFPASAFPSPCPAGTGGAGCGVEGNLGRNTYRGPGFAQVDAGFTKSNRIPWFTSEGAQLQFRAEIANVLNRVNLNGVDSNLADGNFGRATGVNIARTPQFSLRIHF